MRHTIFVQGSSCFTYFHKFCPCLSVLMITRDTSSSCWHWCLGIIVVKCLPVENISKAQETKQSFVLWSQIKSCTQVGCHKSAARELSFELPIKISKTTQVDNAVSAFLFVNLQEKVISKVLFPSSSRRKPKWLIVRLSGPLVALFLRYTLMQQLFTSVSVQVVDIYLRYDA